tara:strand:+ start:773 stop:955 length:183 start_codon:yes stop_codon:yes gene_type:complete
MSHVNKPEIPTKTTLAATKTQVVGSERVSFRIVGFQINELAKITGTLRLLPSFAMYGRRL